MILFILLKYYFINFPDVQDFRVRQSVVKVKILSTSDLIKWLQRLWTSSECLDQLKSTWPYTGNFLLRFQEYSFFRAHVFFIDSNTSLFLNLIFQNLYLPLIMQIFIELEPTVYVMWVGFEGTIKGWQWEKTQKFRGRKVYRSCIVFELDLIKCWLSI